MPCLKYLLFCISNIEILLLSISWVLFYLAFELSFVRKKRIIYLLTLSFRVRYSPRYESGSYIP